MVIVLYGYPAPMLQRLRLTVAFNLCIESFVIGKKLTALVLKRE